MHVDSHDTDKHMGVHALVAKMHTLYTVHKWQRSTTVNHGANSMLHEAIAHGYQSLLQFRMPSPSTFNALVWIKGLHRALAKFETIWYRDSSWQVTNVRLVSKCFAIHSYSQVKTAFQLLDGPYLKLSTTERCAMTKSRRAGLVKPGHHAASLPSRYPLVFSPYSDRKLMIESYLHSAQYFQPMFSVINIVSVKLLDTMFPLLRFAGDDRVPLAGWVKFAA